MQSLSASQMSALVGALAGQGQAVKSGSPVAKALKKLASPFGGRKRRHYNYNIVRRDGNATALSDPTNFIMSRYQTSSNKYHNNPNKAPLKGYSANSLAGFKGNKKNSGLARMIAAGQFDELRARQEAGRARARQEKIALLDATSSNLSPYAQNIANIKSRYSGRENKAIRNKLARREGWDGAPLKHLFHGQSHLMPLYQLRLSKKIGRISPELALAAYGREIRDKTSCAAAQRARRILNSVNKADKKMQQKAGEFNQNIRDLTRNWSKVSKAIANEPSIQRTPTEFGRGRFTPKPKPEEIFSF